MMKRCIRWAVLCAVLTGMVMGLATCVTLPRIPGQKTSQTPGKPADKRIVHRYDNFLIVNVVPGDSFQSLAREFLNDPSQSQMLVRINNQVSPIPGQQVVIPLGGVGIGSVRRDGIQQVPILVYHRFSPIRNDNMVISLDAFEDQMEYLKENGYTVVSLDQVLDFLEMKAMLPDKSVAITVDDGWKSFDQYAYPVLKRFGYPVSLFIYTDFVGKRKGLTWSQIRRLAAQGVDIQCHSKSHRNLPALQATYKSFRTYFKQLEMEIAVSRSIIKQNINKTCQYFAYPYGKTNPLIMEMVKKHGYRGAFTVNRGGNSVMTHSYAINRSVVYGSNDLDRFIKNLDTFKEMDLK